MKQGLIAIDDRAVFRLTGADRERYLNGQVSNQVSRATGTAAIEACVCNVKGKLDAVVFITRAEDGDAFWIDAPGVLRESLFARLSRYIVADDCEIEDITDVMALVHALGEVPDLPGAVWRGADRFGLPGRDLWVKRDSLAGVMATGGTISREVLEDLRIRRGVPVWGAELGPDTLPAEAGLDARAVDFHKGCYLGQEVVSRIESVGRVNRVLVLIAADSGEAAVGSELFSEGTEKPAGVVTSVSPLGPRGLAYVKREFAAPETKLVLLAKDDILASQIWETRAFESGA